LRNFIWQTASIFIQKETVVLDEIDKKLSHNSGAKSRVGNDDFQRQNIGGAGIHHKILGRLYIRFKRRL
jgi:hypothetical protein